MHFSLLQTDILKPIRPIEFVRDFRFLLSLTVFMIYPTQEVRNPLTNESGLCNRGKEVTANNQSLKCVKIAVNIMNFLSKTFVL